MMLKVIYLLMDWDKRKDRLETRAEQAVLLTYFENQAILESIFLYRAWKYEQTK